jgi:hypothetical protein
MVCGNPDACRFDGDEAVGYVPPDILRYLRPEIAIEGVLSAITSSPQSKEERSCALSNVPTRKGVGLI